MTVILVLLLLVFGIALLGRETKPAHRRRPHVRAIERAPLAIEAPTAAPHHHDRRADEPEPMPRAS